MIFIRKTGKKLILVNTAEVFFPIPYDCALKDILKTAKEHLINYPEQNITITF